MSQIAEARDAVDVFLERHPVIEAMPEESVRIARMTRDSNCDLAQLRKLIERDAALSARIMKAVNSSFYALETKVTRLDRAIAYMGLKAVKEVVISSSIAGLCKPADIGTYTTRDLWDHCVAVAVLSRELASRSGQLDPEDAFLAGMLHDVGLLMQVQSAAPKCKILFDSVTNAIVPFTEVEQTVFHFDHCQLGQRLSESWKLPEYVAHVARWHHRPEEAPTEFETLCAIVHIADAQCCFSKVGFPLTCLHQDVSDKTLQGAGISHDVLVEVSTRLPVLLRLHMI